MGKISTRRYVLIAAVGAALCGFLHALPALGSPSHAALLAAARGLAASRGLEGYGTAGMGGRMAGWLWTLGGPSGVAAGQVAALFLGWTLLTFGILLAAGLIARVVPRPRIRGLVLAGAAAIVIATCVEPFRMGILRRGEKIDRLDLTVPAEIAAEASKLPKSAVYANASALPFLLLFSPDAAGGISPAEAAPLALNPPAWREALRRSDWKAVVLSGPIEEYRPLLDHLITAPDWHLAALTNQGYLFRRGPGPAAPAINAVDFRLGSNQDTAVYLAQIAGYCDAVRRTTEARACMAQALERAPGHVAVLSHAATFAISHRRWQEAIAYSNKALAKEPGNAHAKLVKSLALLEIGQPGQALSLVDEVLAGSPNDLYSLFLKARICRTRNDFVSEAETLERIIALNEKIGQPTMNYRIFLGQAYARQGQAEPALANYRAVLSTGELNAEQEEEIREAIATIEAKSPR